MRTGRLSLAGEERRAARERNAERERLTEAAKVIDIEVERQKRAAALFDRADYVSATTDAQRLVEKHAKDRKNAEKQTGVPIPTGEMTDAKQRAFERLTRDLERRARLGKSERPQEAGRDHSGGRERKK